MKTRSLNRVVAALLCFALLLPNFTGLVTAVDSVVPQAVQTNTAWVPAANPFASGEVPTYLTINGSKWADTNVLEYDCGNGLTGDGAKSYMKLVTGTTAAEFTAYVASLTAAGFTRTSYQSLAANTSGTSNLFYRFLSPKKEGVNQYVLTVYYLAAYSEARVIVDTAADIVKDFSTGFVFDSITDEVAQPVLIQYGLSMAPNGYDGKLSEKDYNNTGVRNCGSLTVIRMPDNSLFIHDGGDIQQWSDEACEDFMKFCRELTGKGANDKVVINTWFLSHAHTDHYLGIPRFFNKYHDQLELQHIMYNIDSERKGTSRDISTVMTMMNAFFPNATYYKPHTGDQFYIAGIAFDVVYAQEDRFAFNSNNQMIIDHLDGSAEYSSAIDGTYRDCLYEANGDSDFNDTTTVLKVTFPTTVTKQKDDVTALLYADANNVDEVMWTVWPESVLQADIVMVPHHGFDAHPELIAMSGANIFLYTQAKSAVYGPNGVVDYIKTTVNGKVVYEYAKVDQAGTYRPAQVNNFLAMHDIEGEKYFDTTATRKTYWTGTETSCILFGEGTEFKNMPTGLTRDSEDPTGFTVYTMAAPYFEYTGWEVFTTVIPSGNVTTGAVTTETERIRFTGVEVDNVGNKNNILQAGKYYAIVHDKTNQLMVYNPTVYTDNKNRPAVAGSMTIGSRDDVDNGLNEIYYYINTTSGVSNDSNIYFIHNYRDVALWQLSFTDLSGSALTYNTSSPRFGGSAEEFYYRSVWAKGLSTDASFWGVADSHANDSFRYLQPMSDYLFRTATKAMNDGSSGSDVNYNIRIEFFQNNGTTDVDGDGIRDVCDTCVIYYCNTANTDLRFLTVDEDGNWTHKDYTSVNAAKADLDNLKLRLYCYEELEEDYKKVAMSGNSDYEVLRATNADLVASYIADKLTVKDTSRRNLPIPCSGTAAKVGYYWLDMSAYKALGTAGTTCTVAVKYRNDNGTDTTIGTVTINIVDYILMYRAYNDDDTIHAGTKYGSKYGFLYQGSDVIFEEVVDCANLMDFTYSVHNYNNGISTSVINITPYMLIDPKTGKAVDTTVVGEHTGLQLVYNGEVIDEDFILNVASSADALKNPAYPGANSVLVNKQGTTSEQDFLKTGVANIQLSATGIPEEKGVDLIIVMDLSGSMKFGVDTEYTLSNNAEWRLTALQNSLNKIVKELQASGADVRIAMSDFGELDTAAFENSVIVKHNRYEAYFDISLNNNLNVGYEFYNHLNWAISGSDQNAGPYPVIDKKFNLGHCSYTGLVVPEIYTGSGVVNAGAFVDVNDLTDSVMKGIVKKMYTNIEKSIGTNYDIGLQYAYQLGYVIQQDNIAKGEDRELVCIFMSDGAAMQYNYFSGNTVSTTWNDILNGTPDKVTSTADYYADSNNWPAEIEQISKVMLTQLTTKVENSAYSKAYSLLLAPNYRSTSSDRYFVYYPDKTRADAEYFYTYMDDQEYDIYDWDFLYRIAVANGYDASTFTPEFYQSGDNPYLYPLVELLTTPRADSAITYKTDANGNPTSEILCFESMLQNPDYRDLCRDDVQSDPAKALVAEYKYYELSNWAIDGSKSYTEQLFAAMKALGVDFDWDLYARLCEVNRTAIKNALGLENPRDALRSLIEKMKTPVAGYGDYQTLSPYDYFYNAEGKNWWAEAMKGDPDKLYPVVNKNAFTDNADWGSDAYYGTIRNNFTTGTGLALDGKDYISGYKGLGMDVYSISFAITGDGVLSAQTAENVLRRISSGESYFYAANSENQLTNALNLIVSTMSSSATRGWFVDTMGKDFNLSTEKTVVDANGNTIIVNAAPSIKVMEYDLVPVTNANGEIVSYQRTGTPRVIETVTFEDMDGDGDVDAWSDLIYTTSSVDGNIIRTYLDIWDEKTGLISAEKFYYNSNLDTTVNIAFGAQGSYPLAPESFFWIIGVIGKTEMVLEYQVYLTGSIEGDRFLTSDHYYHATNTNADLRYINYLGQTVTIGTISPEYPWGDGRVGVGFYLVNANGQIISNQTTGETTTDFDQAIKLTRPVYSYLQWNADHTLASTSVTAAGYRPDGYSLYSPSAAYSVNLKFDGSGSWTITDVKSSTYVVTHYGNYKASQTMGSNSYETGDTVVWFAVVVTTPSTYPDTVVVDYGLPVDIDVLGNDLMFGTKGTITALGKYSADLGFSGTTLKSGYTTRTYQGTYGTATIENGKVHYALTSTEMNGSEKINYAVYYTPGAGEDPTYKGYHYNTITVIPATSIYYEDTFLDYDTYKYNSSSFQYVLTNENRWTDAKDEHFADFAGAHQDQDRPGFIALPDLDADSLYGYDSAYGSCSKYSLGSAKKFTANTSYAGAVSFSFYGTGFDVISLTSSDTGTIIVDVYNAAGYIQDQSTPIQSLIVDTYYGYTYDKENDQWLVTPDSDTLYQVPVMKVNDLQYGHYVAVITVSYASFFDHNTADASYDFYMDAVRIYDPAGNDGSKDAAAGDAYVKDGEFAPIYKELRNILITEREFFDSTANLGDGYLPGAVFIDGIPVLNGDNYDTSFKKDPPEIGTYLNYGPNNEVYLAPGQAIAFELNSVEGLNAVHLAMKSTSGTAKIKVFSASLNIADVNLMEIATATDRYYDLTGLVGKTVIIVNVGTTADGILSITNVKFTTDANTAQAVSVDDAVTISKRSASRALNALNNQHGNVSGGSSPETGDQQELMISLMVLASLSMAAVAMLVHVDKRLVKRRKTR